MNKNKDMPKIPLPIRRQEAMGQIIGIINDISARNELPYHVLEDILYRLYIDAREGSVKERDAARRGYEKAIKSQNEVGTNDGKETDDYACNNKEDT